ncbi:MAG: isoaspartyl peptidase/L-asparaginase [Terracidiphilus sp.]|jgi:N4-(beta-N-acetylglucosaminyl)-L-asparaginase
MNSTRRDFLGTAVLSTVSVALASRDESQTADTQRSHKPDEHAAHIHLKPELPASPRLPTIICKVTGTIGIDSAYLMLKSGSNTLDAALHIRKTQEEDPNDHSTGPSGLPEAEGEVQLDACCMHGPTRRAAAVAGVRSIRNASLLARTVMEETGNSLMVGSAAQTFALAHGFTAENLLEERARDNWELWKRIRSSPELLGLGIYEPNSPEPARKAHFLPGSQRDLDMLVYKLESLALHAGFGPAFSWRGLYDALVPAAEPIYVSTVNEKHEMSCAATTSGLPWGMPGASGDVAVIGAGSYLDPEIGSAGASRNADANIRITGAHTIVENMRKGMSLLEAGMEALQRIANWYKNKMTALASSRSFTISCARTAPMPALRCGVVMRPDRSANSPLRTATECGARKNASISSTAARRTVARTPDRILRILCFVFQPLGLTFLDDAKYLAD